MRFGANGDSISSGASGDASDERVPIGKRLHNQFLTRQGWLGNYDFAQLCMPRFLPYSRKSNDDPVAGATRGHAPTPFYGLHDKMPLLLIFICGLQHALAMLAGLSASILYLPFIVKRTN